MKLFKYELKKNILRLPVLLLFAALILVSLYKHSETVQLYGTQDYLADGLMHNIYQAYKGEITDEKIQRIAAYRNEMSAIVAHRISTIRLRPMTDIIPALHSEITGHRKKLSKK